MAWEARSVSCNDQRLEHFASYRQILLPGHKPKLAPTGQRMPNRPPGSLEMQPAASSSPPVLLWAAVTRGTVVLAECGEDTRGGEVLALARRILRKSPSPGWRTRAGERSVVRERARVHCVSANIGSLTGRARCERSSSTCTPKVRPQPRAETSLSGGVTA